MNDENVDYDDNNDDDDEEYDDDDDDKECDDDGNKDYHDDDLHFKGGEIQARLLQSHDGLQYLGFQVK